MAHKIRMQFIVTKEYEPNPEYYPPGSSLKEMAENDASCLLEDPYMFMDSEGTEQSCTFTLIGEAGEEYEGMENSGRDS